MPENQPIPFANPDLNSKYVITVADHEVEIQHKSCKFKGLLSQATEAGIKYLIERGHKIVSAKTADSKPPANTQTEPPKK